MKAKKVLDLFSGAGGFSLGFQQAGCKISAALEIDKWAAETFQFNHPSAKVFNLDISTLSEKEIEKNFGEFNADIIIGGPPCQGYSIANRAGIDSKDPRNSLFEFFVRFGKVLKPKILVMENVPNLLKAKTQSGDQVISIICDELAKLGYHTYTKVLDATDFGVPQIRKRLFVLASQRELKAPFPKPSHRLADIDLLNSLLQPTPTLWEAISDLPTIEAREGAEEMPYTSGPLNSFQQQLRSNSTIVFNHKAMKHGKRTIERFKNMCAGQSVSDVPDHLKPYKRNSNGEISLNPYDQNNRRMHPDRPCHTIPASFYANFVHPFSDRNFTAREGARIQTFPDSFIFKGKPTVVSQKLLAREGRENEKFLCQYAQIGNAVPPFLAKALAINLLESMK